MCGPVCVALCVWPCVCGPVCVTLCVWPCVQSSGPVCVQSSKEVMLSFSRETSESHDLDADRLAILVTVVEVLDAC